MVTSAKKIISFLVFLLGLVVGSILYAKFHLEMLYQINGEYLTFSLPRRMQTLHKLYTFKPKKGALNIILFGGSASYHAINNYKLEKILSKKAHRPVHVVLLSFDDQTFLDNYQMVYELPKLEKAQRAIILDTWSFWRTAAYMNYEIAKSLKTSRLPISHLAVKKLLLSNKLKLGCKSPDLFNKINKIFYENNKGTFSLFSKYFILDKLLKFSRGSTDFLFRDYPAVDPNEDLSQEHLNKFLQLIHSKEQLAYRKKLISQLLRKYRGNEDKWHISINDRFNFFVSIVTETKKLAEKKGYRFAMVELPVYYKSYQNKKILQDILAMKHVLAQNKFIPFWSYAANQNLEKNFDVWWDLVHMTPYGKSKYMPYLADVIIKHLQEKKYGISLAKN